MKEGTWLKSYKSIIPIKATIKGKHGTEEREYPVLVIGEIPVLVIGETKKRYLVQLVEFSGENTYTFPKDEVTITESIRAN